MYGVGDKEKVYFSNKCLLVRLEYYIMVRD